jgi:hypothetical protein
MCHITELLHEEFRKTEMPRVRTVGKISKWQTWAINNRRRLEQKIGVNSLTVELIERAVSSYIKRLPEPVRP